MLTAPELYPLLLLWLQSLGAIPHATARAAVAELVTALLVQHSLVPTALMRALLSSPATPARQRYRRLARAWQRPWLAPAALVPALVRGALALRCPDRGVVHLALDGLRCGPWMILVLGIHWHGRVVPVCWAVLPVPLPRGQFTPTVVRLIRATAAAWPADRPAHLIADREFPSRALFDAVRAAGWGWTVRLRASNWILLDGAGQRVRPLLEPARPDTWSTRPAAWGGGAGAPLPGTLVIGRGLAVVPRHQAGPASLAARARQWGRRQQHVRAKHGAKRPPDASPETDAWVVLFTSHADWLAALPSYRRRWAIEGTFRDAQGGWDGHHGWDLEAVAGAAGTAAHVEALVGLWALAALTQTWIGQQTTSTGAPQAVRQVVRGWTTTGRVSIWARGRLALTDPSGRLRPWLRQTLWAGAARLAAPPDVDPPIALPRAA
jgi:hypothetical protein